MWFRSSWVRISLRSDTHQMFWRVKYCGVIVRCLCEALYIPSFPEPLTDINLAIIIKTSQNCWLTVDYSFNFGQDESKRNSLGLCRLERGSERIKTSVDTGHRAAHDRDYFNWNNEQACNLNGGTFNKYHNQITWWCSFAEVVVEVEDEVSEKDFRGISILLL